MTAAFIEVTTVTGHRCLIGIDHIVAVEPLFEEPDKKSLIRLAVSGSAFEDKLKRWIEVPHTYAVMGTVPEIAALIRAAREHAFGPSQA